MEPLVNKVAQKAIISIDPEDYYPSADQMAYIDMKSFLYKELVLKEADFRELIKQTDWSKYRDLQVGIGCSNDALIPAWAYMLLSSVLLEYAKWVVLCKESELSLNCWKYNLEQMDVSAYAGKRVVIKGCGKYNAPAELYVCLMQRLQPLARSVQFGEACSMVPVFKKSAAHE